MFCTVGLFIDSFFTINVRYFFKNKASPPLNFKNERAGEKNPWKSFIISWHFVFLKVYKGGCFDCEPGVAK